MKIPAWALKPQTLIGVGVGLVAGAKFVWPKVSAWWRTKGVEDAIVATALEREGLAEEDLGSAAAGDDEDHEDVAGASTLDEIEESAVAESKDYFETGLAIMLTHEAWPSSMKQWPDHPEVDYHVTPGDRGKGTNWGVTQKAYDRWRAKQGLEQQSVQWISAEEVRTIYHDEYWLKSGAAAVGWPLNVALFDFAVNSGPGRAVMELQKILGFTGKDVDGGWGPQTALAANTGDPAFLATQLMDARDQFFRGIVAGDPTQQRFLAGWLKRLKQLRGEIQIA